MQTRENEQVGNGTLVAAGFQQQSPVFSLFFLPSLRNRLCVAASWAVLGFGRLVESVLRAIPTESTEVTLSLQRGVLNRHSAYFNSTSENHYSSHELLLPDTQISFYFSFFIDKDTHFC